MVKATFFAFMVLALVCVLLFGATTLTNGGVVYKTFATHPDTPPSGALLLWAKTDGTFQVTNNGGTDSGMGGTSGGGGPAVSAYMSGTSPTFPADTSTPLAFNNNEFDTGSFHSTTVNNTRFVAPSDGYYLAIGSLQSSDASPPRILLSFSIDGGTSVIGSNVGDAGGTGSAYVTLVATSVIHLTATHYVELIIHPISVGTTLFTFDVAPSAAPRMQLTKLF
jgi:hypothetical protein